VWLSVTFNPAGNPIGVGMSLLSQAEEAQLFPTERHFCGSVRGVSPHFWRSSTRLNLRKIHHMVYKVVFLLEIHYTFPVPIVEKFLVDVITNYGTPAETGRS
jgi:hypothetical protein